MVLDRCNCAQNSKSFNISSKQTHPSHYYKRSLPSIQLHKKQTKNKQTSSDTKQRVKTLKTRAIIIKKHKLAAKWQRYDVYSLVFGAQPRKEVR